MRVFAGLAALSALLLAPMAAGAATRSYSATFPGTASDGPDGFVPTDWDGTGQSVTLPQFNPALGTLTGVTLSATGEISTSGSLTNNTAATVELPSYAAVLRISVLAPNSRTPLLSVSPAMFSFSNISLDPGDSLLFGADAPVSASDAGSTRVTGLAPYVGTNSLLFPLTAETSASADNGGLDLSDDTRARAAVTITYAYDLAATAVPEPASAALLGAGLLSLGLLRRQG